MMANHANAAEQQKRTRSTDDACSVTVMTAGKEQDENAFNKASQVINKLHRMIQTCKNKKQAEVAERYLNLACKRYPHVDFWEFRKELKVLFDENYYDHKMLSEVW